QKIKSQQGIYIKGFKTLPKICGRQCVHYLTYITYLVADIYLLKKLNPKKKKRQMSNQEYKWEKKKHTRTHTHTQQNPPSITIRVTACVFFIFIIITKIAEAISRATV
ncbi:hypothetical protein PanWU01x14_230000, partial [Parasponia andersonii]